MSFFSRKKLPFLQRAQDRIQNKEITFNSASQSHSTKSSPEDHSDPPSLPPLPTRYPWSTSRLVLHPTLIHPTELDAEPSVLYTPPSPPPFPRYGHAVPATCTESGDIYIFGGLVGQTVRNDLYLLSPRGNSTRLVPTRGEVPSARVGHGCGQISRVFIVWGGDMMADLEPHHEALDNAIYFLNLETWEWSRLLCDGRRPVGRYGHIVVMSGSKVVVFGGQVDDGFLNDMWSFDLNSLQTKPMWELIEAKGSVPARRSGHVCVAYGDEIVIFGGTDGHFHYNDTWSFDMTTRQWTEMSCIGFIPAVREGHAAAIVKDVMYIFGGRDVRGKPLQDLAALRISDQRWFMFSEMGPAPSGRSGHAMTSFNGKVYVLGGEAEDSTLGDDPAFMHVLDTRHIKYPPPPSPDQEMSLRRLLARLKTVFHDKDLYRLLLECESSDAQALLDSFQKLLDRQDLDSKFRNSLVVATQRLATKSGLYPARYELKDVSQIGDYPVAAGGFSDIYKGDFQGQVVCIKTMRLYQKKQIDHAMKKLSKEAILWGQLSHPNILSIFGIFKFRGLVSIISQWMEHGDVNEYLNNNPSASRLNLALDVVNGLSYIHEHGIIHGDLKGSNVLVDDTGHARLADFGISSISDPDIVAWTLQSASQSEGGTIRWQAPELFAVETTAGGAKNSIESDMYSWGCVCFEIFTGEIPFLDINNNFAVMVAVKAGSRPMRPCMSSSPWTNWGLTDGVWLCMEECWKETPSDRPTASAVAQRFTPGPEDIRQEAGQGMFSPAEFRSRMSQPFDMVAVEFLNNLLHKSQP